MAAYIVTALARFTIQGPTHQRKLKMIVWYGCKPPKRERIFTQPFSEKCKSWIIAFSMKFNVPVDTVSLLNTLNYIVVDNLLPCANRWSPLPSFDTDSIFHEPVLVVRDQRVSFHVIAHLILCEFNNPRVPTRKIDANAKLIFLEWINNANPFYADEELTAMFTDIAMRCIRQSLLDKKQCLDTDFLDQAMLIAVPRIHLVNFENPYLFFENPTFFRFRPFNKVTFPSNLFQRIWLAIIFFVLETKLTQSLLTKQPKNDSRDFLAFSRNGTR